MVRNDGKPVLSHGPVLPIDQWRHRPGIEMDEFELVLENHIVRYSVSSNANAHGPEGPGSEPIWAINLHGYLAGGEMYHRESCALAHRMGWRVVNPSLAGFGGSDPLDWANLSIATMAAQVEALRKHLQLGPVVILGHSMGAAVAIEYATKYPNHTIAVIYRDGIATPSWQQREGVIPRLVSKVVPDLAPVADMVAAVALDLPDLMVGRLVATLRSVLPDVRRNLKTLAHAVPLGSMLLEVDQRDQVIALGTSNIPIMAEWGCFDHLTDATTADEFAELSGKTVQWVPGGHSWMLARPGGQADLLQHTEAGAQFMVELLSRAKVLRRKHRRTVAQAS
jgi:pimeloyl-ACP methyl ester carboxylesterase